jgi:hypothetical protein
MERVPGEIQGALHKLGLDGGRTARGVHDSANKADPGHRSVIREVDLVSGDFAFSSLRIEDGEPGVLDPSDVDQDDRLFEDGPDVVEL